MASIYKQKGRGSYQIAYFDRDGRRKVVRGYRDKKATEELARQIESRLARDEVGLEEKSKPQPLKEKVDEYVDELKQQGRSPAYLKEIARVWTKLMRELSWKTTKDLREDAIRKWLVNYPTESPTTRNAYLSTISGFCEWARIKKYLKENPTKGIKKYRKAGKKIRPRRAYSLEEFRKLIKLPNRGTVYLVAGLSGLRRKEISLLQKRDVKFDPKPQWHLRAEAQKSGRQEILPMLAECARELKPIWQKASSDTEGLFRSVPSHRVMTADLARTEIRKKDDAGRQVDFHALRYFFCTTLARRLPIQVVSKLMRHRDIRTTCNLYMDLGLTDITEATIDLPMVGID